MPIGAVTGRAEIMDAPEVGGLGSTFAGNPLSCAAALVAIETIEKEGLLARSTAIGERFQRRAYAWQKKWPLVGDARGLGAMCAIEIVRDPQTREPADTETKAIAKYCYEHGLIIVTAGTFNNVIRILVPLVVTDASKTQSRLIRNYYYRFEKRNCTINRPTTRPNRLELSTLGCVSETGRRIDIHRRQT